MKKFRYFYSEEGSNNSYRDAGSNSSPEVLDLEFMQYAKNDISALVNQLQAEKKADTKGASAADTKPVNNTNDNIKGVHNSDDKRVNISDKGVNKSEKEVNNSNTGVMDVGESRKNCSAKIDVAFAKTHKTGGTTVQNILFRFGEQRRLSFVLPKAFLDFLCYFLHN